MFRDMGNPFIHDVYVREPRGWRIRERRLELLWDEDRPTKTTA